MKHNKFPIKKCFICGEEKDPIVQPDVGIFGLCSARCEDCVEDLWAEFETKMN